VSDHERAPRSSTGSVRGHASVYAENSDAPSNKGMKRWTIKVCPSHGPFEGKLCRVVVERTSTHTRYCHREQEVEVIPASSPNVLSEEEARLLVWACAPNATGSEIRALVRRLADFAKEGSDRG
jgi:hypothetical protein